MANRKVEAQGRFQKSLGGSARLSIPRLAASGLAARLPDLDCISHVIYHVSSNHVVLAEVSRRPARGIYPSVERDTKVADGRRRR